MAGLKFRVLLDNPEKKEIFRDILIDDSANFEEFYKFIIQSFELDNDQMASFFVSDGAWNKGEEISLLNMAFGDEESGSPQEMHAVLLNEKLNAKRQRFILIHDFLSMWIFLIELQETTGNTISRPSSVLSIGEIPTHFRQNGPQSMDDLHFEADIEDGFEDFDSYNNDLEEGSFENYEDYDF